MTPSPSLRSLSSSSSSSSPSSSSSSSSSSPLTPSLTTDAATRCRYKTGRCLHARVVKPNGSLLLLCEFHRDQQNRTKKRSDMKYRHHRAKKRQMDKYSPMGHSLHHHHQPPPPRHASRSSLLALSPPPPPPPPPLAATRHRHADARASSQQLSPIVSTPTMLASATGSGKQPLHAPGAVLAKRASTSSASLKKSALYKLSSGLRATAMGSRISPGKTRMSRALLLAGDAAFSVSRRDIVAMASPHKPLPTTSSSLPHPAPAPQPSPLSAMVFPLCLSPLRHISPWQPEDVRLLEYFIL